MNKKLSCKTELQKNIINKNVFKREIDLCKKLSKNNNGKCCWGKCENCGVVPLLYKLHKGKLLEGLPEIKKAKNVVSS